MGSFVCLPPALLAALPLLWGPAAWATNCGCGAGCDVVAEEVAAGTACECGPAHGDGCCEVESDACACVCQPAEPLAPAVATTVPAPVHFGLAPPPSRWVPTRDADVLRSLSGTPAPAADRPLRAWLCVWRI